MSGDLPRVERDDDGHPVWVHACRADVEFGPIRATLPIGASGWAWTDGGGVTPSILCRNCGVHGFWVGGSPPHWRPC